MPNSLSYLPKDDAAVIAKKVLVFLNQTQRRRFIARLNRIKNKNKNKELDNKISTDRLINLLLQEFYDKQREIEDVILQNLTRINPKN